MYKSVVECLVFVITKINEFNIKVKTFCQILKSYPPPLFSSVIIPSKLVSLFTCDFFKFTDLEGYIFKWPDLTSLKKIFWASTLSSVEDIETKWAIMSYGRPLCTFMQHFVLSWAINFKEFIKQPKALLSKPLQPKYVYWSLTFLPDLFRNIVSAL